MPSLKEFRNRIASVKSTRKITSAMKMVAASKLRRAQMQAEQGQPYAKRMGEMLQRLIANVEIDLRDGNVNPLMAGTGADQVHLLVVITSDRGLCGGFNATVLRLARQKIAELSAAEKTVKLFCVGRKGRDSLRRDHADKIVHVVEGLGRKHLSFADTQEVTNYILTELHAGSYDVCTLVYNQFKSVIKQDPTVKQLVPFELAETVADDAATQETGRVPQYTFEPDEKHILESLLPKNLSVQVYGAMLDSAAGEQAARMTAMDNATRNAGDMISRLTLRYNRARQAYITKELIEIISGAEAV